MRTNTLPTKLLFFDTDSLSSFLRIDVQYLLSILYKNRIVIPKPVYMELSKAYQGNGFLRQRLDKMIKDQEAFVKEIEYTKKEFDLYRQFINGDNELKMAIGKGEASCLALSIAYDGIIVSDNLKDVQRFVELYKLKHLTVSAILKQAYDESFISEDYGNQIWQQLLDTGRKIAHEKNFSEYLNHNNG